MKNICLYVDDNGERMVYDYKKYMNCDRYEWRHVRTVEDLMNNMCSGSIYFISMNKNMINIWDMVMAMISYYSDNEVENMILIDIPLFKLHGDSIKYDRISRKVYGLYNRININRYKKIMNSGYKCNEILSKRRGYGNMRLHVIDYDNSYLL